MVTQQQQHYVFYETFSLQKYATKASFALANKIAKPNKSFAEAEFIKDCVVDVVTVVCSEAKSKVETISLLQGIIVCRIDAIAVNIHEQLLTAGGCFQWFSITFDQSTDLQDTAQLLVYIKGINENFEITEELLSMKSLKDPNTIKDLFNSAIDSLITSGLTLNKVASIITDGSYLLTGMHSDLVKM